MLIDQPRPRLAAITLHPIKSLDPVSVAEARIGPAGGLELDRVWALYSTDGRWVNGKRTPAIHRMRAAYAPGLGSVTLSAPGDSRNLPPRTVDFPADTESAALWFSIYFEQQILVRHSPDGFPDDTIAHGPTIVSTASLEKVCEWFPGMTLDEARRRFRASLEIDAAPEAGQAGASASANGNGALPAFWEDQLFGADATTFPRFRIGEVNFEGSNPCARCPVPPCDSFTGADTPGFQKRFSDLRRETLPSWSPAARFDHFYRFATNTRVASVESGKFLRLGDPLILC
ncbi:MAG: MOSC domain-containing protein [Candidatus Acidiferrum sp.]